MTNDVDQRLAEIGARAASAQLASWEVVRRIRVGGFHRYGIGRFHRYGSEESPLFVDAERDSEFITHAREDVPWLLEQLKQAREELSVPQQGEFEAAEGVIKMTNDTYDLEALERHTPGPWRAVPHEQGSYWDVMVGASCIAEVYNHPPGARHNAALIAAAPALLAEVRRLREYSAGVNVDLQMMVNDRRNEREATAVQQQLMKAELSRLRRLLEAARPPLPGDTPRGGQALGT